MVGGWSRCIRSIGFQNALPRISLSFKVLASVVNPARRCGACAVVLLAPSTSRRSPCTMVHAPLAGGWATLARSGWHVRQGKQSILWARDNAQHHRMRRQLFTFSSKCCEAKPKKSNTNQKNKINKINVNQTKQKQSKNPNPPKQTKQSTQKKLTKTKETDTHKLKKRRQVSKKANIEKSQEAINTKIRMCEKKRRVRKQRNTING